MLRSLLRSTWFSFIVGGLLGLASGAGAMLIAFPFLFPPAVAADAPPQVIATATARPIALTFDRNAPGRDPAHWANGNGRIVQTEQGWVLRFEADFEAGPGPNFWIYFNTRGTGEEKDFLADAGRVKVTPVKSFKGAQNYALPANVDPTRFHTVTIWCETFGVYIGSATLRPA
jgi:hypothetical protein